MDVKRQLRGQQPGFSDPQAAMSPTKGWTQTLMSPLARQHRMEETVYSYGSD
jgi:hypothetical protein